jgi:hypothetical protein
MVTNFYVNGCNSIKQFMIYDTAATINIKII